LGVDRVEEEEDCCVCIIRAAVEVMEPNKEDMEEDPAVFEDVVLPPADVDAVALAVDEGGCCMRGLPEDVVLTVDVEKDEI
jgi:hypothetical protein